MKRLRYDVQRNVYVDDVRNSFIDHLHVSYLGDGHRLEKRVFASPFEENVALEEQVKRILKELFPRKVLQPNAYALSDLHSFFTLDFLFVHEGSFVSLSEKVNEAAK